MAFEQELRQRLKAIPYQNPDRGILKVVLGEVQQLAGPTDEQCHGVVKKLIEGNTKTLALMPVTDLRHEKLEAENRVLVSLLPSYWDDGQILSSLTSAGILEQIRGAVKDGQAVGLAMKHLKQQNAPVEGETVRRVVEAARR